MDHMKLVIIAVICTAIGLKLERTRRKMKGLSNDEKSFYSKKMERLKKKYFVLEKKWYKWENQYLTMRDKLFT